MHFAVMHYAPVFYGMRVEEARSFEVMIERGRSVAQLVLYILLLAAGLYHGLYGVRGILRELPLTPALRRPWILASCCSDCSFLPWAPT